MGLYGEHVLPRIVDFACNLKAATPSRQRVCEGLAGDVVEIGFGSGLNVPFYPPARRPRSPPWSRPTSAGSSPRERRRRVERGPVERSGLDGQSLPFADDRFDTALSTWTMCTIPDRRRRAARAAPRPQARRHAALRRARARARDAGVQRGSTGSSRCRSGSSAAAT